VSGPYATPTQGMWLPGRIQKKFSLHFEFFKLYLQLIFKATETCWT